MFLNVGAENSDAGGITQKKEYNMQNRANV